MPHVPFPAPGPDDAESPLPSGAARDGSGRQQPPPARPGQDKLRHAAPDAGNAGVPPATPARERGPGGAGDDDWDGDAEMARFLEEVDAGRIPVPDGELRAPAVLYSIGEVADVDPVLLALMAGPDGLAGQTFSQHKAADAMRPGPLLSVLTEQAARDVTDLSDDALFGMVSAARRLQNRAEYLELAGIAEFTRRRAEQYAASVPTKRQRGPRPGEFADAELAMELLVSDRAAGDRMDMAAALATRLPRTFAGLADGTIDGGKASAIWFYTRFLSDTEAAQADAILSAAAPELKPDQLARKAAALEMKLDPEAVRQRKEQARKDGRRVEARRELSGNMSFGGRELSVEEGLAVKAFNDGDATALRAAGMSGRLADLRVLAYLDRLTGRDPLDRLTAPNCQDSGADKPSTDPVADAVDGEPDGTAREDSDCTKREDPDSTRRADDEGDPAADEEWDGDGEDGENNGHPGTEPGDGPTEAGSQPGRAAPVPALINLVIPAGTLLGWSTAPGDAGTWGLLDADDTRRIVMAASQHSRTRWCVTAVGPDGTAIAHGCARGPHRWTPAGGGRDGPAGAPDRTRQPGPDAHQQAQLDDLLRHLNVTLAPIASGTCDHRHREDRYTPSRKLKHLVRARTATCPAPGCGGQAYHSDLDHTIAWPAGATCECNLSPPCRRHHRVKQAPGWHLEQPGPGIMRWTTPSGRSYTTTPTVYDT